MGLTDKDSDTSRKADARSILDRSATLGDVPVRSLQDAAKAAVTPQPQCHMRCITQHLRQLSEPCIGSRIRHQANLYYSQTTCVQSTRLGPSH